MFLLLQLHGMMRVILEPLIGDVPIVGAVTMFFIKRPVRPLGSPSLDFLLSLPLTSFAFLFSLGGIDFSTINTFFLRMAHLFCLLPSQKLDINWTGLTNLLDIPGLK